MDDIYERVTELAMQRYCCAQIVMIIGLEKLGKNNPDLVCAMKGMCHGFCSYRLCGTLAACACVLSLFDEHYSSILIQDIMAWFEKQYGSVNCCDILGGGKKDMSRCHEITAETCLRCLELMDENKIDGRI